MSPCPHCGGTTVIEAHRALRWTCAVCGGPVVPADVVVTEGRAFVRSNAELASLVRAKRARAAAFGWTAGTVVLALAAAMTLGLGALLLLVAKLPAAILGAFGIVFATMAMGTRSRAKANDAEAQRELEAAWESVAHEVLRVNDATAAELAKTMRTTEAHAEQMLAALSAGDRARVAIDDDAELHYSAGAPRVRIGEEIDETTDEASRAMKRTR
jgi:hypothetical protein